MEDSAMAPPEEWYMTVWVLQEADSEREFNVWYVSQWGSLGLTPVEKKGGSVIG